MANNTIVSTQMLHSSVQVCLTRRECAGEQALVQGGEAEAAEASDDSGQ